MKKLGRKKKPQVKKQRWYPMVCTPAYNGMVHMEFAQAFSESAYTCPFFEVRLMASIIKGGAFIDLTRNIFVRMFLQDEEFKECTHLFFIDSDLKWSYHALVGLVRSDLPICAGVYRKRQDEEEYPVKLAEHPTEGGLWVEEEDDGFQWIMAERVPTGFLCIRRDIIEEMAADCIQLDINGQPGPVPDLFTTGRADGPGQIKTNIKPRWENAQRYVGEDFAFCDKYLAKYNKPIHIWPDIDFWHDGYVGNYLRYLERKIEGDKSVESY